MSIKMIALRSLSASQSPSGAQIARGAEYEVPSDAAAEDHIRRGQGRRAPTKPPVKGASKGEAKA